MGSMCEKMKCIATILNLLDFYLNHGIQYCTTTCPWQSFLKYSMNTDFGLGAK